jgi:DNA invertase Pin-like site-specific DNA recombinase
MAKPMLIGYARVSTVDQNLALHRDALTEAGCARIFTEQMSGAVTDRPASNDALEFVRSGDTLIVWKLDRLARSVKQLIETVETLRVRGIGFRSLIRERTQAGLAARLARGSYWRRSDKTHRRRH